MNQHIKEPMRLLPIATVIFASALPLLAQGQIVVTGSESLQVAPFRDFGVAAELPESSLPISSDWLPRSQRLPLAESSRIRSDRLSLSPLPLINPPNIEITAATITLTSVNFEPPVNLSSTTIQLGQVNYSGDSSGVERIEAFRSTAGISGFPILPPTPDPQIQFAQASEIQPAPEPSTFALGGLALGLVALFRASVKAKKVA